MKNLIKMPLFQKILDDQRINVIIDDARRYLLSSGKKFDSILTTPPRMTEAYNNNINSVEFFAIIKQSLRPQGTFMIWAEEPAIMNWTLIQAFDHLLAYSSFSIVSNDPIREFPKVRRSLLNQLDPKTQKHVLTIYQKKTGNNAGHFWGDIDFVKKYLGPASINTDLKPVSEYYLGMQYRAWLVEQKRK